MWKRSGNRGLALERLCMVSHTCPICTLVRNSSTSYSLDACISPEFLGDRKKKKNRCCGHWSRKSKSLALAFSIHNKQLLIQVKCADPSLNGHLKYPNNLDQSLNDAAADKIRKYRADYNNRPPSAVSFMPDIASTSVRLHSEFVRLLFQWHVPLPTLEIGRAHV